MKICSQCDSHAKVKGLCPRHYAVAYRLRGKSLPENLDEHMKHVARPKPKHETCIECDRTELHAKGLCKTHYAQLLRARKRDA